MVTPFLAVLVRCFNGHYEVTTAKAFKGAWGPAESCARCDFPLVLVKEAMILPDRRHSDMPCYQTPLCVLA